MLIAGLQKNSTLDFPGRFSSVIFLAGCNYDCYFCHNRHIIGENVKSVNLIPEEEVLAFLEKRKGLLEGVVITGGEPALQKDAIPFAKKVRDLGYDIKLDTNGSRPEFVKEFLMRDLVDYVAVDYKAPFDMYPQICAHDASGVAETLDLLKKSGIEFEMRTTVIPELREAELIRMAQEIEPLEHYFLQLYRPVKPEIVKKGMEPYTPMQLKALAELIKDYQPSVQTRA